MTAVTRRGLRAGAFAMIAMTALAPTAVAGAQEAKAIEQTRAIGESFTISGPECLIDGKPGEVFLALGLYPETDIQGMISGYVPVRADGSWTITVTIPEQWVYHPHYTDLAEGRYMVAVQCDNPQKHGYFHQVPGDVDILNIEGAVTPPPTAAPTTPPPAKPAPVKVKPHFTG